MSILTPKKEEKSKFGFYILIQENLFSVFFYFQNSPVTFPSLLRSISKNPALVPSPWRRLNFPFVILVYFLILLFWKNYFTVKQVKNPAPALSLTSSIVIAKSSPWPWKKKKEFKRNKKRKNEKTEKTEKSKKKNILLIVGSVVKERGVFEIQIGNLS